MLAELPGQGTQGVRLRRPGREQRIAEQRDELALGAHGPSSPPPPPREAGAEGEAEPCAQRQIERQAAARGHEHRRIEYSRVAVCRQLAGEMRSGRGRIERFAFQPHDAVGQHEARARHVRARRERMAQAGNRDG